MASHVGASLSTTAYIFDSLAAPAFPAFRERKRPIDEDFKRSVSAKVVAEGRAASGVLASNRHLQQEECIPLE